MLRHARRRAAPRAPVLPAGSRDSVRRVRRLDRSRYYAAYVEAPPEPQFQLRWRYLQAPARTVFCLELGVRGAVFGLVVRLALPLPAVPRPPAEL